ncbi:hypothetical protein P170DRAFT_430319 [Aspergillus steynii IBT 23096]|uniref:Uncharacterized protein n=1 Tax=Aspergillus steynii IBT 23096 TaxID=1392250 RepID=A0A2I2FUV4_9EURO|nr:uncharacterized protein P170DRAFT_430319 [Aspergillus steynii IBT 23096]PLB44420.1 hypothetical protein P170DRAFT_430319 [Aspergillus steynii IBT 23096]
MDVLRNATPAAFTFGQTFAREHPTALAVGSAGLIFATAPLAGPAVLGTLGFSATGPVAAGSPFATFQGAAMGGPAAGIFTTASGLGAGIVGGTWVGYGSGSGSSDGGGGTFV